MKLKLVETAQGETFTMSSEMIAEMIKKKYMFENFRVDDYIYDENGEVVGIKGAGNTGSSYGSKGGWEKFNLRSGEQFEFTHHSTSIEGPSDWGDMWESVKIEVLEEE